MGVIGVDIGGTKIGVVAATAEGKIYDQVKFLTETNLGPDHAIGNIIAAVERMLSRHAGLGSDLVFGISCGGPLDSRAGLVLSPPNLPGWDRIPITRILQERFGGRAFLMNDANACALAEWWFGAARGCSNVVFLTFGTGMGAGLILDRKLYTGTNDLAGEVGHIRLAESGPTGYGKAGSFEGFCSGGGIRRLAVGKIRAAWEQGQAVGFCRDETELASLDARRVAEAAAAGDQLAVEIMETTAHYLGRGLALLVDLLNPEVIVIGSIYARCEALLRPTAIRVLREEALSEALAHCRVVPAGLGEEIGNYAAVAVALHGRDGSPDPGDKS